MTLESITITIAPDTIAPSVLARAARRLADFAELRNMALRSGVSRASITAEIVYQEELVALAAEALGLDVDQVPGGTTERWWRLRPACQAIEAAMAGGAQ